MKCPSEVLRVPNIVYSILPYLCKFCIVFIQVFFSESLCSGPEGDGPISVSLPGSVTRVYSAAFLPSHSARVAVIHSSALLLTKHLSVFDISMKKAKYEEEPSGKYSQYAQVLDTGKNKCPLAFQDICLFITLMILESDIESWI